MLFRRERFYARRIASGERVVLVVTGSAKPVRGDLDPLAEPIEPDIGAFLTRLGLDA